jgi:hypothetical protein
MGANVGTYDNILLAPSAGSTIVPQNQLTATASGGGAITFSPNSGFTSSIAVGDILTVTVASQISTGNFSYQIAGGNVSNWILTSSAGNNVVASIWVGQVTSTSGSWSITIPATSGDTTTINTATLCSWKGLALVDPYNPLMTLIDQSGSNFSSGSTTGFPSLAPTTGGEMVLGVVAASSGLGSSIKSGWTALSGSSTQYAAGYYVQPSGNAYQNPSTYAVNGTGYGWNTSAPSATAAVLLRPQFTPLAIQGIVGNPSTYQVFDGDGNIVAAGDMPQALGISLQNSVYSASATSGATQSVTLDLTTTSSPPVPVVGDTLIATIGVGAAGTGISISGGGVSTWTEITGSFYDANAANRIFIGKVTTTGFQQVAVSLTSASGTTYCTLSHWRGISPSPFDTQGNTFLSSGPSQILYGPAITPTNANELYFSTVGSNATLSSFTGTPTFTELNNGPYKSKGFTTAYYLNSGTTSLGTNAYGWNESGGFGYSWFRTLALIPAGVNSIQIPPPNGVSWQPGYYYVNFDVVHSGTYPVPVVATATVNNGSNVITSTSGWSGVSVGMTVTGAYTPSYTTVTNVNGNNLTLSNAAAIPPKTPPVTTVTQPVTIGWSIDSVQVSIVRQLSGVNLPTPSQLPAAGSASVANGTGTPGFDLYLHGFAAIGPERYAISDGTTPTTTTSGLEGGTIASIQQNLSLEKGTAGDSWYFDPAYQDPARPRTPLVNVPNNVIVNNTSPPTTTTAVTAYKTGVSQVVGNSGVGPGSSYATNYFEGLNEPAGQHGLSAQSSALQYYNFRQAVKNGNVNAIALGPSEVSSGPTGSDYIPTVDYVNSWIQNVRAYGGDVDGISLHLYNGWDGDFLATDGWLSAINSVLSNNGISVVRAGQESTGKVSFWVTEAGNIRTDYYNVNLVDPTRMVVWMSQFLLVCERWGIPKEQIYFFYDSNHGFDYLSWIRDTDNSLRPFGIFYRVYSEELWGKAYSRTLDFGPIGNGLYLGNVFTQTNGSTTGTCVTLIAQGMYADTVTLSGVGYSPVTYSNWQGVTTTVTPDANGSVQIPIKNTPTYVRLSASAASTVAVATAGGGLNNSTNLALSATATGSYATNISRVNDGVLQTGGFLSGPDYVYQAPVGNYVELDWAIAPTITRVVIRQVPPWTDTNPDGDSNIHGMSVMLTGTLQYWNGIKWVGCPTTPDSHWDDAGNYSNPSASNFMSFMADIGHSTPGNNSWVSFYDQNWVLNVSFKKPIVTSKIKFVVTSTTVGNMASPTLQSYLQGAEGGAAMNISEIMVFNTSIPNQIYGPFHAA